MPPDRFIYCVFSSFTFCLLQSWGQVFVFSSHFFVSLWQDLFLSTNCDCKLKVPRSLIFFLKSDRVAKKKTLSFSKAQNNDPAMLKSQSKQWQRNPKIIRVHGVWRSTMICSMCAWFFSLYLYSMQWHMSWLLKCGFQSFNIFSKWWKQRKMSAIVIQNDSHTHRYIHNAKAQLYVSTASISIKSTHVIVSWLCRWKISIDLQCANFRMWQPNRGYFQE